MKFVSRTVTHFVVSRANINYIIRGDSKMLHKISLENVKVITALQSGVGERIILKEILKKQAVR